MHREEMEWLCNVAALAPDGMGLEVGVYCGASLIAWSLARLGRGRAVGVDDWSYRDIAGLREVCIRNLVSIAREVPEYAEPLLINERSERAATSQYDPIAFLFIDGDHTRPHIELDIDLWTPKVMPGGIVAFHDYGRHKAGCYVKEAVDAWVDRKRWAMVGLVTTTIAYQRPL